MLTSLWPLWDVRVKPVSRTLKMSPLYCCWHINDSLTVTEYERAAFRNGCEKEELSGDFITFSFIFYFKIYLLLHRNSYNFKKQMFQWLFSLTRLESNRAMISNLIFLCIASVAIADEKVKYVAVIFRHGDRTPVNPYPTDPWRNESFWPVKFGELTNVGKRQHFALGQWLRKRYSVRN